MSFIHYFPRYSQKENMVTNNTLLLFSRLYNYSNIKFNRFINAVFEDKNIELDTSVRFSQQERGLGSVPDGIIQQESFKIIIETKLYGQENLEQISNHVLSFGNVDKKIFLWINTEPIDEIYRKKITRFLNKINEEKKIKINFASTTFKEICKYFNEAIFEYDIEMKELITDFEAFCNEEGLIDNSESKLRAVLAGNTYEQNMEYNIYYAPSERGYQKHRYLGLYKQKSIRGIGEVISSADINYNEETETLEIKKIQFGQITESQQEAVKKVILEARDKFGYELSEGHRFFFVEKFYETNFMKPDKGGLMGQRYFDLADIEGYVKEKSCYEISEWLKGKYWK